MALDIKWTQEAEHQLDDIIEYLTETWTQKEINAFFKKLEKGIKTISDRPLQQKKSLRKIDCYEYQVSPQTTIFYDFVDQTATILVLWSNRMNPENL
ncbi:MAG: type II toxin-antitoxin system RelE/ParE family toxin [Flavobacteriales bacterium]|nr:type II toxin-antitoxin system RelE/ParE family toxin [Flavobacteriales bacterium]